MFRKGKNMPLNPNEFKMVGCALSHESVERLDRLALKGGISRAQLMINMIEAGIEFLETCEGWGVFAIKKIFDDMKAGFSQKTRYRLA